MRYEADFRREQNVLRRKAITALALEGKIASESEIRSWRARHEAIPVSEGQAAGEGVAATVGAGSASVGATAGAGAGAGTGAGPRASGSGGIK